MGITGFQWAILVSLTHLCRAWHMTRLMLVSLFHISGMLRLLSYVDQGQLAQPTREE